MTDLYFAYGSNMSSPRLRERIPGATPSAAARVEGFRLACNKRGKDGSGKANLVAEPGAEAWGVLFRLGAADWPTLDRFEWGYERHACRVLGAAGGSGDGLDAQLYLAALPEDREIAPFDWYRDHCLAGAREHSLPQSVLAQIAGWTVELTR